MEKKENSRSVEQEVLTMEYCDEIRIAKAFKKVDDRLKALEEAVNIVRCRDCKAYGEMLPGKDERMICHKWALTTKPCDFCSYGEQKDGGADK